MNNVVQTDRQVKAALERVAYGLSEGASALGIGETLFAEIVASGQIPSFRIGRRRLIRKSDLIAYADRLFNEQNGQVRQ
ncbi:MAG: helix-turn-helix domain-containing protein [Armatimonadota bacterium]|nr:helix-turn-helix domain-containing protein [bacterium]